MSAMTERNWVTWNLGLASKTSAKAWLQKLSRIWLRDRKVGCYLTH